MNNTVPAIEIAGLEVRYGRRQVLDALDLVVAPGEVRACLGRNGVGKSSLVRCLLGHQKPRAGTVRLLGQSVWAERVDLMQRVGVVPENGDAPPAMDALGLSRFCARLYRRWDESALIDRLQRFEVPLEVAFGDLSKGQKCQVMLALALAHGPELLVLDDPTLGLDSVARKAVFEELVVELADRGTTVFLTSHDLPGIEGIATHIASIAEGRLLLDEPLESLKARFRRIRLGSSAASEALDPFAPLTSEQHGRDLEVVVSRFDDRIFEQLRRAPGIERLEAHSLSLEEILIAAAGVPAGAAEPSPEVLP